VREPGVPVNPENTAFGFQSLVDGIEYDDLIDYRLNEHLKITAGLLITAAIAGKPDPVVVLTQVMEEFYS
jgi:hypothetical protein